MAYEIEKLSGRAKQWSAATDGFPSKGEALEALVRFLDRGHLVVVVERRQWVIYESTFEARTDDGMNTRALARIVETRGER